MKNTVMWLSASVTLVTTALADTIQWRGVNTSWASALTQTNLETATLWNNNDGGSVRVPGAGDRALLLFNATVYTYRDELFINPASSFAPDSLQFGTTANMPNVPLYQFKDLTLTRFDIDSGGSTGGFGNNRWRIGSTAAPGWLRVAVANTDPGDMTGTIDVTGNVGTRTISLAGNPDRATVAARINAETANTGVKATVTDWTHTLGQNNLLLESTTAGPGNFVQVSDRTGMFITERWGSPMDYGAGWAASSVTLTLTGTNPVNYAGATGGSMMFGLYNGSRLVMNNAAITLTPASQTPWTGVGSFGMSGTNGTVEFTAAGGSVQLQNPGVRGQGSIHIGANQLRLRSDQNWLNPASTGFIRQGMNANRLAASIDGGPLTNLAAVAFVIDTRPVNETKEIGPGEYQGLYLGVGAGDTTGYTSTLKLMGNVMFRGSAVLPGNNSAVAASLDPAYGLILSTSQRMMYMLNLNGYTLTLSKGLKIASATSETFGTYHNEVNRNRDVNAKGSTLVIGGDLEIYSNQQYAGNVNSNSPAASLDAYAETRLDGVLANAATVITIAGSFKSNVRSRSSDTWEMATVNLVGGSALTNNTFEVGSDGVAGNDGDVDGFTNGTYTIGVLNIGDGATPGFVRLVNNNLNDGDNGLTKPVTQPAKSKDGEILMAKALSIKAGSVLDCNGLGAGVSNSLAIAADAWLDLHTGAGLAVGDTVTRFWGAANQTAVWSEIRKRVKDSSNPTLGFQSVYVAGANRTYWQATPLAATGTLVIAR